MDLLSFTLLIIQHDQLISLCDLNVCKFKNKNIPVELPVSTETLVSLCCVFCVGTSFSYRRFVNKV